MPKPSLREANARLTPGLSIGATSMGTATLPKRPLLVLRSEGSQSRTIWGGQAPDPKVSKGPSTHSPQVSRLAGTLGGNTLMGTDCLLRGTVSNTLCGSGNDHTYCSDCGGALSGMGPVPVRPGSVSTGIDPMRRGPASLEGPPSLLSQQ